MPGSDDRIMAIESPLGDDCVVTRLSGEERINDLYSFSVAIACKEPVDPEKILGEEITVTIKFSEDKERPVRGLVARMDQVDPIGDNVFEYNLEVVPPLWVLGLHAHTQIFEEMTTIDIVEQVVNNGCTGLKLSIQVNVNKQCGPRETCLQYNETDLEFITRLLAEDGISYFFKHKDTKVELVLIDAMTSFPKCDPESYEYRGRTSTDTLGCVSAFRRSGRLATDSFENFDYCEYTAPNQRKFESSSSGPKKLRRGTFQHHAGQYFERKGDGRDFNTGDAKMRVKRWLEGMEADAEYFTAESDWPSIAPGHIMKLKSKPVNADDTEFLVCDVMHEAIEGQDSDSSYSSWLRCAPTKNTVAFRPTYVGEAPRIWGVQTATVEEVRPIPGPGVHAEVKVRFPWYDGISCWARVAQLYAGNKWGGYFVPELDQEVLVEFISGNPDRPVIVGAVYNSNNPIPPYNKWQSGIRTRSGDYNELLFTDKPGEEVFYTEAGKDYRFLVHNDQTGTVENDRTVEIQNDDTLTVLNNRTITVEADDKLEVHKSRNVEITENFDTTVLQGDYSLTVDQGDYNLDVKTGKQTVKAAKSITMTVGGSSITMKTNSIELKMGGSVVKLGPSGVEVSGPTVKTNATGLNEVKAGGMVQVQGGIVKIN